MNIPKDSILHSHRRENPKSSIFKLGPYVFTYWFSMSAVASNQSSSVDFKFINNEEIQKLSSLLISTEIRDLAHAIDCTWGAWNLATGLADKQFRRHFTSMKFKWWF
jgi:hypothetical protein